MRIVASIGDRALLGRNEGHLAKQPSIGRATEAVAGLAHRAELVVTYGDDLRASIPPIAGRFGTDYLIDVLEAESEGLVGYLLEQHLQDVLPDRQVATLLTRVEVDPADPAFQSPSHPVGAVVDEETARMLASANRWLMVRDSGGRRRAVASPEPVRVLETRAIELLISGGVVVVCCGGGGIPVVRDRFGGYHGVDAVVEKDLSAALVARDCRADLLLLLTDTAGVWVDWGSPGAKLVRSASPDSLRALQLERSSIGAKVEAACRFVEWTGHDAIIGAVEDGLELLEGTSGTRVSAAADGLQTQDAGTLARF
ncbi:MAG: carbamate kinase [Acidimicrobiales bacterium]